MHATSSRHYPTKKLTIGARLDAGEEVDELHSDVRKEVHELNPEIGEEVHDFPFTAAESKEVNQLNT